MAELAEPLYDGADRRALAAATGARSVIIKPVVHSTLDVAHVMAQGGAPSGTLILAEEQAGGRGRAGRPWHSPRGGGIWMTLLLRPRAAPAGGSMAIRTGLAVADALAVVAPRLSPCLKWPNDIVVNNRKAGGVLCEARWTGDVLAWVAVGVGLNVRGPVAPEVEATAIAIGDVAPGVSRRAILGELVPRLLELDAAPPHLGDAERARFLRLAWAVPGETVTGIAADGALTVRRADGLVERRVDAT